MKLVALFASLTLVACAPPPAAERAPAVPDNAHAVYVVGGEVRGLRGIGLLLKNARGEEVKIGADGAFIFNSPVDDGTEYAVTIAREPISPVQSCAIDRARGRIDGRDAMEIAVTCSGLLPESIVAARALAPRSARTAIAERY